MADPQVDLQSGPTSTQTRKRLRIGMALDNINRYGGLTRSAWEICQRIAEHHDVIFLTTEAQLTYTEKFAVKLLRVPKIPYVKKIVFAWKVSRQKKPVKLDLLNVQGTSGLWQDVVTAQSVHKKWFFWSLARTPKFSKAWWLKILNPVHYVTIAIEEFQYRPSSKSHVIAISHNVKNDLVAYFGIHPSRVDVVHHGVNVEEFVPSLRATGRRKMRDELGLSDDRLVIIFAAHEFRRKGLGVLLSALAKMKVHQALLVVVGMGDPTEFTSQIVDLGLEKRVTFFGRQTNIADWYAMSDIFAFPTSYEAFGMVITEAMAAGLPVIVPKDAGAAELVTHDVDGMLLDRWDDQETLTKYLDLLSDPQHRERIGKSARLRAESWTWDDSARKTLEVYEKILARQKNQ